MSFLSTAPGHGSEQKNTNQYTIQYKYIQTMNHSSAISSPYVQFVLFFPHQKCSLSTQMLISQKRDLCHWINLHEHTSLVLCCLLLDIDWLQERILFAKNVQRLTTERKIHVCLSLHGAASFTGACFFCFFTVGFTSRTLTPIPFISLEHQDSWVTETNMGSDSVWQMTESCLSSFHVIQYYT